MPRGMDKRKGPSLSFFNRSDQDKWVGFVLLSTQFSVFVRDHVGRKRSGCETAILPFPLKWGPPSPPFFLFIMDRDFTDAEGSLLTRLPTLEASRQKEAARTRSCRRSCPPPLISLHSRSGRFPPPSFLQPPSVIKVPFPFLKCPIGLPQQMYKVDRCLVG
ncbi:hypothetical protein Ahy_B10g102995 [Arachis hypogaea]|uniref:Uncharacterized protein n=1 Tax=Arachis hypogaea TaxID=3818 RepID=A0A444X312_ARAHY|nr:hypothetical protein Ahy_B10g102995 [Arachis hypogaea]